MIVVNNVHYKFKLLFHPLHSKFLDLNHLQKVNFILSKLFRMQYYKWHRAHSEFTTDSINNTEKALILLLQQNPHWMIVKNNHVVEVICTTILIDQNL